MSRPRSGAFRPGALFGGCTVGLTVSWNIANTGPVATQLAHRYGVSLGVIGLLPAVLFFAEVPMMLPGGRAIDRWGAKPVGMLAVALSLVANLGLLGVTSPAAVLALRALAGAGVGLGFLAGAVYVQGDGGRSAMLASGIYGGVSLGGGGLALAIVPQVTGLFGWQAPYASAAIVAAIGLLLLAPCPRTQGRGRVSGAPSMWALALDSTIMRVGAVSACSFGFSVILGNWVVTLLERTAGYSTAKAGAIGSLILMLAIAGRLLGGAIARALGARTWHLIAWSFVVGAVAVVLLMLSAGAVPDIVGAATVGLVSGLPFGSTLTAAARARPDAAGLGVGAMNTYAVLSIVVGAPLLGLTFSLPGDGRIGFAVVAALWVAALRVVPYRLEI
ncbi:MAG: MFS transporter [Solirubrobacteraceae bacterium]